MGARDATDPGSGVPDAGPVGRPASALPSVRARVLAFAAILAAGTCGALIGLSFVRLQCHGNCTVPVGLGGLTGAVVAAGGVAVVAVLTLRAMGEWRTIKEDRERDAEQFLEAEGFGPEAREAPALPAPPDPPSGGGNGRHGDSSNRRNPSA